MRVMKWRALVGIYLSLLLSVPAGVAGLAICLGVTVLYLVWFDGAFVEIEAAKMREARKNPAVARLIVAETRLELTLESPLGQVVCWCLYALAVGIFVLRLPYL